MDAEARLWDELHELFDTDDGSLPDVVLYGLQPKSLQSSFDLLRKLAAPLEGQTLWHEEKQAQVPVEDVADAPTLVAAFRIPPFHVRFSGIRIGDVPIPTLGAFTFQEMLALDYRMGEQWNPTVLGAFARLLGQLKALAPEGHLAAVPGGGDVTEHAEPGFEHAIARYLGASSSLPG
jgi:hypothetical protein